MNVHFLRTILRGGRSDDDQFSPFRIEARPGPNRPKTVFKDAVRVAGVEFSEHFPSVFPGWAKTCLSYGSPFLDTFLVHEFSPFSM
jgi:hypothetical protein